MQLNQLQPPSPAQIANELAGRLEAANLKAQHSGVSKELIDCVLKVGLTFAAFLTELLGGAVFQTHEQILSSLEQIEEHCHLIETQFPSAA